MKSLKFMVDDQRIWLYGFVIMPNHIHLMWRRQDAWINKSTEQIFLKFTAQQIKFRMITSAPQEFLPVVGVFTTVVNLRNFVESR